MQRRDSNDPPARDSAEEPLARLLRLLDLEAIEVNLFRGHSPNEPNRRIFGGLVVAQGLRAALNTVEDRLAHSLHAYFLRPGDPKVPILYEVDRIRDGRSFTTRRVVAIQSGQAILNMAVSCQKAEESPSHQIDEEIPHEPQGEPYEEGLRRGILEQGLDIPEGFPRPNAVEMRVEGGLHMMNEGVRPPELRCWIRARGTLPDDPALHQCVLAYSSDFTIMVPASYPLEFGLMTPGVQTASLDHALWLHRPFLADEWLYVVGDSPITAHSRGLGRASFYTRDGTLVASCAQEGLLRKLPDEVGRLPGISTTRRD